MGAVRIELKPLKDLACVHIDCTGVTGPSYYEEQGNPLQFLPTMMRNCLRGCESFLGPSHCDQTSKPPSWEDLYNITEVAVSRFPAFVISSAGRLWWEIHQMLEFCAKLNILFSTIWVSQFRWVHLDVY